MQHKTRLLIIESAKILFYCACAILWTLISNISYRYFFGDRYVEIVSVLIFLTAFFILGYGFKKFNKAVAQINKE